MYHLFICLRFCVSNCAHHIPFSSAAILKGVIVVSLVAVALALVVIVVVYFRRYVQLTKDLS